jgi:hypothetical protein
MAQVRETLKDVTLGVIAPKAAVKMIKGAGYTIEEAQEMVDEQLKHAKAPEPQRSAPHNEPADKPDERPARAEQTRRVSQRDSEGPMIRTLTDTVIAGALMQRRASQRQTTELLAVVEDAKQRRVTPTEMRDLIIEQYDRFDHARAGEALAEGMVLSEAIAIADEADRAAQKRAA